MSDAGGVAAAASAAVAAAAPPPAPAATNGATPPASWFSTLPEEDVGFLQTKGWADPDPAKVVPAIAKAYRDLEGFRGVPADQIFKWPKDTDGLQSVWDKLGVPSDAANYNFDQIAYEFDNRETAEPVYAALRELGQTAHLTNDQLVTVTDWLLGQLDGNRQSTTAEVTARVKASDDLLRQSWGPSFDANNALVDNGFARIAELMQANPEILKQSQGALDALRDAGYGAWGKELLRVIGKGFGEDRAGQFTATSPSPAQTREEAKFKMAEFRNLQSPKAQALLRGDPAAQREYDELIRLSHAGEEGW